MFSYLQLTFAASSKKDSGYVVVKLKIEMGKSIPKPKITLHMVGKGVWGRGFIYNKIRNYTQQKRFYIFWGCIASGKLNMVMKI